MQKPCSKCNKEQLHSEYRNRSGRPINTCRSCEREYQRNNYRKNIEAAREKKRTVNAKRRANPETAKILREQAKAHYHKKGKHTERRYYEDMKKNDPFEWRARNLRRNASNEITKKWLLQQWKTQEGKCVLSGRCLDVTTFHVDHITPKKAGGSDALCNLRLVCPEANMAKSGLTDKQLIKLCQDILDTQIPEIIGRAIMELEH